MKPLATALAVCALTVPVLAQDGTGTISGTLDLQPASWVVASAGDGPTSGWTETDHATRITLVGTPEARSDGGPGTLTIEMDVTAGAIEAQVTDAEITLQRADEAWVSNSETVDLRLEAYQRSGTDLVVAGSFAATLFADPVGGLVVDTAEGVTVDGNFQATIQGPGTP